MILEIDFVNHQGTPATFSWNLFDKRYTQAFKKVNENWIASRPTKLPEYVEKWFVASTEEDFIKILEEIKNKVIEIDKIGVINIGSTKITKDITREELNRLHEIFHQFIEDYSYVNRNSLAGKTAKLCHNLNDLVHLTEDAWSNKRKKQPETRIIATAVEHMHVPYEEEDYQYFEDTRIAGSLYIGYATPGKSLYHCHRDNDMSVIKKQLVRQSQGISCEIHIEITGKDSVDVKYENQIGKEFDDWCQTNKVKDHGYDYTLPIYRPGRIPLGRMIQTPIDFETFINNRPGNIKDLRFI